MCGSLLNSSFEGKMCAYMTILELLPLRDIMESQKQKLFFLQNSVYSSVKLEYSYLYNDIIIPNFSRVNTGIHHCNRITEQEKLYNNSH